MISVDDDDDDQDGFNSQKAGQLLLDLSYILPRSFGAP